MLYKECKVTFVMSVLMKDLRKKEILKYITKVKDRIESSWALIFKC